MCELYCAKIYKKMELVFFVIGTYLLTYSMAQSPS